MRFPGNCLIVSLAMSTLPGNKLRTKRNRMGRLHFYWQDRSGRSWEFYKRGASGKTYLQNSFYFGEVMDIGKIAVDRVPRDMGPEFVAGVSKQRKVSITDLLEMRKSELWDWIEEATGQSLSYPNPFAHRDGDSFETIQMKARGVEIINLIDLFAKMKVANG